MQRLIIYCALVLAAAWVTGVAGAADYKLKDGTTLSGEAIGPNEKSVIIKAPDGKLLPRTPWANFSQEALKEFAKNPKIRAFVELLIEETTAGAAGGDGAAGGSSSAGKGAGRDKDDGNVVDAEYTEVKDKKS